MTLSPWAKGQVSRKDYNQSKYSYFLTAFPESFVSVLKGRVSRSKTRLDLGLGLDFQLESFVHIVPPCQIMQKPNISWSPNGKKNPKVFTPFQPSAAWAVNIGTKTFGLFLKITNPLWPVCTQPFTAPKISRFRIQGQKLQKGQKVAEGQYYRTSLLQSMFSY